MLVKGQALKGETFFSKFQVPPQTCVLVNWIDVNRTKVQELELGSLKLFLICVVNENVQTKKVQVPSKGCGETRKRSQHLIYPDQLGHHQHQQRVVQRVMLFSC